METLPVWLQAGVWGLVAGSALVIGAAIGYFTRIPHRVIAAIMAFGSGVLISALSFDLVDEAHKRGGFVASALGFFMGAAIFTERTGTWRSGAPRPVTYRDSSNRLKKRSREAAWPLPWAP